MNKKGAISDTDKTLFWLIFVLPILGLVVTMIFIAMPTLIDAQTTISKSLQRNIYESVIIGSPYCLAYEEPLTNKVINGYIDISKLNKENLQNCVMLEGIKDMGFFLTIYKEGEYFKELESKNVLKRISSKYIEHERLIILVDEEKKYNGVIKFTFY